MMNKIPIAALANMNSNKLLDTRFCDLDFDLNSTFIPHYVERLYKELERAGLKSFRPKVYFGDEWFCPDRSTLISVPFYLAHPRLSDLEERMTGTIEGKTPKELMRLLRHEAGHCFNHAYALNRKKSWQALFGSPRKKYCVENYKYDPTSKDFVRHLRGYYAQSHPDEDFAETFAVWLNPYSRWRTKYRTWDGAFKKLKFVDDFVRQIDTSDAPYLPARPMSHVRELKSTLGRFYRRRNTYLHSKI